jgi:uncharacterized membrane protein
MSARLLSLLAATVATGLSAGLFFGFACAVMPGLARTGDRTFTEAMRHINVAIVNPVFLAVFAGSPLLIALATLAHLGRPGLPWVAAALVLYLAGVVITGRVNIPLNNELEAAGDQPPDPGAVRARFEARWVRWHLVRTVALTASFTCLTWALAVT